MLHNRRRKGGGGASMFRERIQVEATLIQESDLWSITKPEIWI